MKPVIYHNPRCGTSRNTLAIMKDSGEAPEVIEYLKEPPSVERIFELLQLMQITPRELIRQKESAYKELGLDNPALSDKELVQAIHDNPILFNRPVVVTDKGARLCRPSERVFELLDTPVGQFTKEDGEQIYAQSNKTQG